MIRRVLLLIICFLLVIGIIKLWHENEYQKKEIEKLKKILEDFEKRVEKIEKGKATFIMTAYTSSRDECDDTPFITASNKRVRWGIIAMDKKYPLGTKVYIPYFKKTFVCEDRGGAIRGNKIDIWMPSKKMAIEFGRRKLIAYVIKEGKDD